MSIPTLAELMSTEITGGGGFEPLAPAWYDGVITKVEVKAGQKAPYLNVEVTVHGDEHNGRKVWGISSFSDKALTMPGGVVQILQATEAPVPMDTAMEDLPAVAARALTTLPVSFLVKNEQVKRGGALQYLDAPTNSVPEMRSRIEEYRAADEDFAATVDAQAAGLDADLPF